MGRTLRSKKLRALLWHEARGRCQSCGEPLGDDWHADHVAPWSVTRRTNVHEMRALCAACNQKKGARMPRKLRRFQRDLIGLCERIQTFSSGERTIILDCTPGGGKSTAPQILAKHLIPRRADRLCWVVPRQSLQEQAERQFLEPDLRALFGHGYEIRQSTNDVDPCRGKVGFVTTYQAVAANPLALRDEFLRPTRYVLVLDEVQHVEQGGPWERALRPMVERAAFVVLMSGTFERGDGRRIAWVPYRDGIGGAVVDFDATPTRAVIRYPRRVALEEEALKRLHFRHVDARAEWIDAAGSTRRIGSLDEAGKYDTPAAVYTALHTDYAYQLLERTVADWRVAQETNPRAKLLVVAAQITTAKRYLSWLRKKLGVVLVEIATSEDSESARQAIERFKRAPDDGGSLEALVTVAMAYEGMDVPSITHVACLTHIRSRPWIEQMLARAARVDHLAGPYELQAGTIWGPDDLLLRQILDKVRAEQAAFVREPAPQDGERRVAGDGDDARFVVPIDSAMGAIRVSDMANGTAVGAARTRELEELARRLGFRANAVQLEAFLAAAHGASSADLLMPVEPVPAVVASLPSQREAALRRRIEDSVRRLDHRHAEKPGTFNGRLFGVFGKSRSAMSEEELTRVWQWLREVETNGGAAS